MYKYSSIVNQERRKQVLDFIKEKYSLSSLLVELGVWDGTVTVIKCPFHPDSRPSFNINVEDNFYKCFSCGRSGGYISFYHNYHSIINEDGKGFNQHVEEVLNKDADMKEALGFSTIFVKVENQLSLEELSQYTKPPVNLVLVDNRNMETIRRKLIKGDVEVLLDFYADIERGMTTNDLWNKYIKGVKLDDILLTKEDKESIENDFRNLLLDTLDNEEDDDELIQEMTNLFDSEDEEDDE